ncbi:MAG: sigma-70 family RNA polymerase sigma factor [Armatimonadetes bacterium]|nr:MAG: sigma-70 family RNA polymerase sigma factor [Armatimonadota bacterium]KXK19982.1 MAG: RNA polymerase, sigma subunit, ECF family [Armatimonadetes bacterium OLB18]WKZ79060.1 MAG: sigma-70 family RNA polymerase sigma factor [Fimbriimonadaceae bacterium]MBL1152169.1 sigma-70 family RNA polymerase sigma factor [Armatimonadota bacterium]NOG38831.1 sigma-70 family RNA polymerase sigma factor [Armatimonadota bacterium]
MRGASSLARAGMTLSYFLRPRDFEKAVEPELSVLFRVARRMGATFEEAEDLVQTTLLKAYQQWERFDGRFLRSWLIRILRNERLMNLRSARPVDNIDDIELVEEPDSTFWSVIADRLDADEILRAIETLPEPYRLAVHFCDVEDMTYEEASEAMEVPIGTVRSRLFRGRKLIQRQLAGLAGSIPESDLE